MTHDPHVAHGSPVAHSSRHPQALHHPEGAREAAHAGDDRPLIRFDDFCFAYDEHVALRHVTLDICAGDSVVLMGDNGSGKSTLLKAMSGLVLAQQGRYLFGGEEVDAHSMRNAAFSKRLHQQVGLVFQDADAQLFCASVGDEVAFGPRQMGLSEEEVARRVGDTVGLLQIEDLLTRAPYNLSGGEKKKVAIASIVSMNPSVYCFDEPLNGLDQRTRRWLLGFMQQLRAAGKTLVVATHDQSLADELADYFVYFGDFHGYEDRPHVHLP